MNKRAKKTESAGFTLAELLVVITVIVLLFTVVAPQFSGMISAGIEDSAVSVISAATATARVYATRTQSFSAGSYQGAALLFTPSGEVRIVRHVESAVDGNGTVRLVDKNPPHAGYEDLPGEDFFNIPEAVGVVGVTRGGANVAAGELYIMPPPFAIRFNSDGSLISRRTLKGSSNRAMYYDGTGDGRCTLTGAGLRTSSYNANLYDPRSSDYVSSNFVAGLGKIRFGIDGIDTVVAVIAFNMNDFLEAGYKLGGTGASLGSQGQVSSAAATWLKNNGRTIYFNRYTGTAITP